MVHKICDGLKSIPTKPVEPMALEIYTTFIISLIPKQRRSLG
jgi:hypothetical protein